MTPIYTAITENGYAEFLTREEAELYSETIEESVRDLTPIIEEEAPQE